MGNILTISAVNAAADTLTITGHGLHTGDGFLRMFGPNGATLPGGLAAVTDYWAIVVDANTIKLATSSANALAGTAIDITSTGSGTLDLVLGIPYCVPRIAAPGGQVFSADDNGVWGALRDLWSFMTGQSQSTWQRGMRTKPVPIAMPGNGNVAPDVSTSTVFSVPVGLDVGDKIVNLRVLIKDSATGPTTIAAQIATAATFGNPSPGGGSTITAVSGGTTNTSSGAGTVQTLTASNINYTILASTATLVEFLYVGGAAAFHVYAIEVDYIPRA